MVLALIARLALATGCIPAPGGAAATVPPLPAHKPVGERVLFPFDPVVLIGTGDRTEGDASRESAYGNFRYRFTTDASKRAFDAMPDRFAIAFGGCCARMGPLGVDGEVGRFEVIDEKLYIFASDACRDGFVKDPRPFLDVADQGFATDRRGVELGVSVRRWLRADAACAKEISVWASRVEPSVEPGRFRVVREEVRLAPDLTFTSMKSWDGDAFWTTATFAPIAARSGDANARRSTVQGEQPLDASQFEAFRREAMLEPLFLSRVLVQPDVKIAGGGSAEWRIGTRTLAGEILRIHWRGVTVDWLVKPGNGQPVAQSAMRRGRDARFVRSIEAFDSWNDHAGVRVPLVRTDGISTRRFDAVDSGCDAPLVDVVPVIEE